MLENVPSILGNGAKVVSSSRASGVQPSSARFQALLDKLEASASELQARTDSTSDAKDLSKAVETAHESLQDALTLSEELLEAFRAAQRRASDSASSS